MAESLAVYLSGRHVATLHEVGLGMGAALEYLPEVVEAYGTGTVLLSVGLPVRAEPYPAVQTRYFLEGMLPESEVRSQLADRAKVAVSDTFGLLRHFGLDCAGAVQFVSGAEPDVRELSVRWLGDNDLLDAVARLPTAPLGIEVSAGVRSSLGGAQGKLPLVVEGERCGLPENGYPSTHILKPARLIEGGEQEWPGIVAAEAFAMRVIAAVHAAGGRLEAAGVSVTKVGTRPALLVERFDRTHPADGSAPHRIHQEDGAQALGLLEKYQRVAQEPPRLVDIAQMLRAVASVPARELEALFELTILNVVLGNCDAHVRNVSLVLDEGRVGLAPAYDVVPTSVWPRHDRELALRIGGEFLIDGVRRSHLLTEAASWNLRSRLASRVLDRTLGRVEAALDDVTVQARDEGWWDRVLNDVVKQSRARAALYRI